MNSTSQGRASAAVPSVGGLIFRASFAWAIGAVGCFHIAYTMPRFCFLILGFLFCLFQVARLSSGRQVFYVGVAIGMAIYVPQLNFFWNIFQAAAIPLWLVLSFWLALFLLLAHVAIKKCGAFRAALMIPFLWTGLEYFRSELYYLRFSWLSVGGAFPGQDFPDLFRYFGLYGIGFLCAGLMSFLVFVPGRMKFIGVTPFAGAVLLSLIHPKSEPSPSSEIHIAGVQLEFREEDILSALEKTRKQVPQTDIYVLSEYTFSGEPPKTVRKWCREHAVYLVAGGREGVSASQYYNTAFVVGTNGDLVFQQAKSVPIQFFKDGLPATQQKVWDSPWGKIGLCICYDFSYRQVVDNLVDQGAQLLIVPTMDVVEWGEYQHRLHGRIAPMRAAEYDIPVFRLCSSGISQAVTARGQILATAPFPGQNEIVAATLPIRNPGQVPMDRWLAPLAVVMTAGFILWIALSKYRHSKISRS